MALLFMDSFDHYATANLPLKWTTAGAGGAGDAPVIGGTGRHSSNAARVGPDISTSTSYLSKTLVAGDATCIGGVAVQVSGLIADTTGCPLVSIRDGASAQVTVRFNSTGTLSVVRGAQNGTVLGTTASTLATGSFSYIEWKVLIHPSAGTVDLKVNGSSVLSLTGQNTRATANSSWDGLVLGVADAIANTATGGTIDYDDLYVLDGTGSSPWNGFLGDCRVDARFPTGGGASTGWTPSTGANWQNVDDATPNDDTDYNSAATTGLTDTFVVQDAPVAGGTVLGVQLCLSTKKSDAGSCELKPVVRHSGTDQIGIAFNPTTSYAYNFSLYPTNPGTSAAWTESDFNAAEFGVTRTV